MTVTAIIVTYNSEAVITDALDALENDPNIASILVVDNASTDGTTSKIKARFPSATILANSENEGFGRANNRALEIVRTPFALLVNPDAVIGRGCVSSLLEAAEAFPEAAILAPKLIGTHGSVHESFKRNVFHREANKDRFHLPDAPCCAEFLSGAVWLMRMEHISRVGFFDPKIFLFYEDDDLCMRTREAGYSLVYVPQSVAYHAMGKSSPADAAMLFFKQKHMMLGRLYLEEKYRGNDAVKRLIRKLTWKNRLRLLGARITFQHRKALYYRARLSGIAAFGLTAIQ